MDEIQTGFSRTGKILAMEHSGVVADLMGFAKGFANEMPISGIVTIKEISDCMPAGSLVWVNGSVSFPVQNADMILQGGTHSGNVVVCAAALATTRYMRSHDVSGNVECRSNQIFDGLRDIQADEVNGGWMIEEIRGKGVSTRHGNR